MNTFVNLLAADGAEGVVKSAYQTFLDIVNIVMPIAISIVLIFGIAYGIVLGIKFAKAEDTDARDKAKSQLINMIIGVVVAAVIISVVYIVLATGTVESLFPKVNNNIESTESTVAAL